MSRATANRMAVRFAPGTRVVGTDGPTHPGGPEPRRGTLEGTVVRFVKGNNAQGGYAVVEWDNGHTGRMSPGGLAVVEEEQ